MISFRPMQENEFSRYTDYFVSDYAHEISENYGLSLSDSLKQAQETVETSFPQGPLTESETLLCIIKSGEIIGYIWYRPDQNNKSVYIYDFHILPDQQGQGYGKQALKTLEENLSQQGFKHIKLRVAADNTRAQHVYEASGFRVTGINMNKTI
ncbi:GNAT family N-acetyltransferase [Acetobacter malorum]|uniref:GNAT family N-acetyltransferase n=1 Tax=Acetobacter malorum TaxID=178901 RepID=UPI0039E76C52